MKNRSFFRVLAAFPGAAAISVVCSLSSSAAKGSEDSGGGGILIVIGIVLLAAAALYLYGSTKKTSAPEQIAVPQLQPISDYEALDPKFDAQAFSQKVTNLYVRYQQGLTKRDIYELQPYCTKGFYRKT